MCHGEYESLKAIYAISPSFVPKPYAWGKYDTDELETYFLLAEFRDVGEQVRSLLFDVMQGLRDRCVEVLLQLVANIVSLRIPSSSPPVLHICTKALFLRPGSLASTSLLVMRELPRLLILGRIPGVCSMGDTLGTSWS
jgi:hypothetical protein